MQLAVGDALGSSFVDSTLSLAAGPIIRPVAISSQLAVLGSLAAAGATGSVIVILVGRKVHDWRSGVGLVIIFVLVYLLLGNLEW
jgi:Ca2+/Na+ antiporter